MSCRVGIRGHARRKTGEGRFPAQLSPQGAGTCATGPGDAAFGPEWVHERWRPLAFMYHPDLIRHPDSCPALVLNADYTPLSYYPLSLWPWQTAVKAMFLERVDVVANYSREVHSPTRTMQIPSVIALRQYVKPSQFPAF